MACESEVMSTSGVGNGPKVTTGNGATATILIIASFLKSICNEIKETHYQHSWRLLIYQV